MSTRTEKDGVTTTVTVKPLNLLHASPTNPRKHFSEAELEELRESIRTHGFKAAFPIYVRPSKTEEGKHEIIAGERRFRASSAEGLDVVPVVIEEVDDKTVLELQLIENLQRKALTDVEEAWAYERMRGEFAMSIKEIAARVGKGEAVVAARLAMLRAPKLMLEAAESEESPIGVRHCVIVAGIPDAKLREKAAKEVLTGSYDHSTNEQVPMSVKAAKQHVRKNYMISLRGAPWDVNDDTLLPSAGACALCPHFVKRQAETNEELKAELSTGKGGKDGLDPLTCMNPTCHENKMNALWKLKQAEAKKSEDVKLMPAEEVKKQFKGYNDGLSYDSSYVKLEDKPGYDITGHYDDKKVPSYKAMLEKAELKPKVTLARDPHSGAIVELMEKKAAHELARKALGKSSTGKKELTSEEKKQRERTALNNKVSERQKGMQLDAIWNGLKNKPLGLEGATLWLKAVLNANAGMDGARLMCDWLKLEPVARKKGESVSQEHYQQAILNYCQGMGLIEMHAMTVVAFISRTIKLGYNLEYHCKELLAFVGMSINEIHKAAEKEVKEQMAAKKAKAEKKAPPLKPKVKPVNDGMASGKTVSGAKERPTSNTEHPTSKGEEKPVGEMTLEELKAAKAELKKPKEADGKAALAAWNKRRMALNRAMEKVMAGK